MESAAYPAQTTAIFDNGVEYARKDGPDHPEDIEVLIYGASPKHSVRANDSPNDGRGEECTAIGTRELGRLVTGTVSWQKGLTDIVDQSDTSPGRQLTYRKPRRCFPVSNS